MNYMNYMNILLCCYRLCYELWDFFRNCLAAFKDCQVVHAIVW